MAKKLKLSRRDAIASAGALTFASVWPSIAAGAIHNEKHVKLPNILFIMADDLGYADVGCYGSHSNKTPNVDKLARSGLLMRHGYANSCVCSATRIGLITGRYQDRFRAGLELPLGPPEMGLPAGTLTMPNSLRELGYNTALIGKWHMGSEPGVRPTDHGYEYFFGIYGGATDYYRYGEMSFENQLVENAQKVQGNGYLTDVLGERGARKIQELAKSDRPFFMSFHFTAPHWPWEKPGDNVLEKGPIDEWTIMQWDRGNIETYSKIVANMDYNVGKLLAALEAAGIADNTIVVFTSDNGGERFSDVWPLTGVKTELLEGGIRVPIIIRWPSMVGPGTVSDQVMISMDFMPTLLAACGLEATESLGLDGTNLLPQLLGKEQNRERTLHWRYKARNQRATRCGRWKYLTIDGEDYLFDLEYDQRERANFKDRNPDMFQQLSRAHNEWESRMLAYPIDSYAHDMRDKLPDR